MSDVREAILDDCEEITRLCNQLGYSVTDAEIKGRFLAIGESDTHLVAVYPEDGESLSGWIAAEHRILMESGERVEIVALIVDSEARRGGIGRELVAEAERWTAEKGLKTIFVRSNIARDESHPFYLGLGYERTKTQHAYSRSVEPGEEN